MPAEPIMLKQAHNVLVTITMTGLGRNADEHRALGSCAHAPAQWQPCWHCKSSVQCISQLQGATAWYKRPATCPALGCQLTRSAPLCTVFDAGCIVFDI